MSTPIKHLFSGEFTACGLSARDVAKAGDRRAFDKFDVTCRTCDPSLPMEATVAPTRAPKPPVPSIGKPEATEP